MKHISIALGLAVLAMTGISLAQNSPPKPSVKKAANGGSAVHGKDVFSEKCAVCHNTTSTEKKIGPGLKGIFKRGTFTVNGAKITEESLKAWIENGDTLMPPFRDTLTSEQIKDLTAYLKTL